MNTNYDEILNKYVDNELNQDELKSVENLVNTNPSFSTSLKVHKYVHDSLHEIPVKSAPSGITELVMNKIFKKLSEKYKKNYLFRGVISVLSLILIVTLFILFSYLGDLAFVKEATSASDIYFDKINPVFNYLYQLVKTDTFKTVAGLLGFIILIAFYFNLNSHKELKEKLNQL